MPGAASCKSQITKCVCRDLFCNWKTNILIEDLNIFYKLLKELWNVKGLFAFLCVFYFQVVSDCSEGEMD